MKRNAIGMFWICMLVGCQGGTTDSPEITAAFTLPAEWTAAADSTPETPAVPTLNSTTDAIPSPSPTSSPTRLGPDAPGIIPVDPPAQHPASITLQNVNNLREIARLSGGYFYDAVWSPDGKTLAVARPMGIEFYNAVTGELSGTYGFREAEIIQYTPDGKFLVMSKGTTVWIARMAGGEIERTIEAKMPDTPTYIGRPEEERIQFMAVSPDGKLLALGGRFGHHVDHNERFLIEVWDLKSGELTFQYKENDPYSISRLVFSSDSKRILYANELVSGTGRGFRIINVTTGDLEFGSSGSKYADFLPDGSILACMEDGLWMTYDSMGEPKEEAVDMPCDPFTVSKDGERIAFEYEEEVLIWDYVAQEEVSRMKVTGIADAGFSPNGRYILLGNYSKYDTGTGEHYWSIKSDAAGYETAFLYAAPAGWEETKGPFLVASNANMELSLWSLHETRRLNAFSLSTSLEINPVNEILTAPDGRTVLFSTDYGWEIWIHDVNSEEPSYLFSCEGSAGYMMAPSMQFSADGKKLLLQCPENAFILNSTDWSLADQITAGLETEHGFRGNGELVGMETVAEGIRVWNALSGETIALFGLGSPPSDQKMELLFRNITFTDEYFTASELMNGYGLMVWDWRKPQSPIRYTGYIGVVDRQYGMPMHEKFSDMVFHPFENLLALTYRGDEKIVLINAETGWPVRTFDPVCGGDRWGSVQDLEFSLDGRYLAAACLNGIVWVYGIG
jgi:WD40 repeat protein